MSDVDRWEELIKMEPINRFIPHIFPGGAKITELTTACKRCGTVFREEQVRGAGSDHDYASLSVLQIHSASECEKCGLINVMTLRIKESVDGVFLETYDTDNGWMSCQFASSARISSKMSRLYKVFKRLRKWVSQRPPDRTE